MDCKKTKECFCGNTTKNIIVKNNEILGCYLCYIKIKKNKHNGQFQKNRKTKRGL